MPASSCWQFKAATSNAIKVPNYCQDNPASRSEFIRQECKNHWFFPEEAEKLAQRLEQVISGIARYDKLQDKRLIWIIEAAKQRRLESLQQKLE